MAKTEKNAAAVALGRVGRVACGKARAAGMSAADYELIRQEGVLGSEAFRQELLAAASARVGPNHYGAERQETGLEKAERIVREELGQLGWTEEGLRGRSKGHSGKVRKEHRNPSLEGY